LKINLLYDISVFGMAYQHQRARTGIYRVVENIALGLLASGKCDLVGYASQGNDDDCLEYLAAHPQLSSCSETFVRGIAACERLNIRRGGVRGLLQGVLSRFSSSSRGGIIMLPDVNICHSPFYPLPEQILKMEGLPTVLTVYDLIPLLFPQFFDFGEDEVMRTMLERLNPDTFITCISASTKQDLCNHAKHIDPERVFVTYLAASDNFYPCHDEEALSQVRKKCGIPESCRYILSVCTLEPRKNVEQTIRCFVRMVLDQGLTDLCLVLTGAKGWSYDKILAEVEYADAIKDRIVLTGFVSDEELAPLYSGALAFVYPSLYEGFGLPPLEAMQCGTPVITSNTSSLPEVVGGAGFMVDPTDGDALCQALLDLYHDSALRTEMAQKSIERAKLFSWEKTVQKTIDVYQTALGS
jgi:glycosyltransferase involved in cell wall biosynthesis